jgi:hypothetical protein
LNLGGVALRRCASRSTPPGRTTKKATPAAGTAQHGTARMPTHARTHLHTLRCRFATHIPAHRSHALRPPACRTHAPQRRRHHPSSRGALPRRQPRPRRCASLAFAGTFQAPLRLARRPVHARRRGGHRSHGRAAHPLAQRPRGRE